MDIPSRIKIFLDTLGIPNSQFADTCGIPRPSLSQLLNGRNKKVSDEVIGKIHEAYPKLSVLWLMFGEGDMTTDGNIEISEAQNDENTELDQEESSDEQDFIPSLSSIFDIGKVDQSKSQAEKTAYIRSAQDETEQKKHPSPARQLNADEHHPSSLSLNLDSGRRVVSIMVLYSDKSFETFVPKGS